MSRKPAQPYDVNGRTVFITGAARGIGAETARRLHGKGANVALVGMEPERLEELAAQLGDRTAVFEVDVTDFGALQRAVSATVERFGGIDVGIANAGIAYSGPLASAPIEQVERTLAVNFLGVWRTDRALIGQIVERKGYLLNIASLAAIVHAPIMAPYASAKAGVEALTDCLRIETAPSGARVGCAYFGFIDTDLVRASFAQPSAQRLNGNSPGFLRNPVPVSKAIDAIEQGIERRAARLWAPRWVGAMIALRSAVQPFVERNILKDEATLVEGMQAAEASHETDTQDPLLGVAVQAV
ncbi:MAG TPA: short-chain dehydrogenase/reductase, partial [Solirubrobacteraceae bacterium]|nr:short-chain dehydrogenase/reductase [Solirubrobacteraceae bacterium]